MGTCSLERLCTVINVVSEACRAQLLADMKADGLSLRWSLHFWKDRLVSVASKLGARESVEKKWSNDKSYSIKRRPEDDFSFSPYLVKLLWYKDVCFFRV